ncbi:uncharacterized protein J4E78_003843 [Alternaria triticimaculans]|uniref:uncharacterized protein n=1 Tax=Alternaria triticimaculans TaxID=297637 RepID=UPI0020C29C12|nr:uncharacterized protein J4E78_003843 [Alternaria triticimaculans]KAI4663429.1 hypothetical protein J4E78_003843 [Alternaria triticimaculans]
MDSIFDTFRFLDLPKDIRLLVYDYLQPESHLVSIFGNHRCLWCTKLRPSTALLLVNRLLCDEIRAYFGKGYPGQPITLVAPEGHCTFALHFLAALSSGHRLDMMSKEKNGDADMPIELSKFTQMVPTRQLKMRIQHIDQMRSGSSTSPLTEFDDTTLQEVYRLCVLRMRKETYFQLRVLFRNGKVEADRDLRSTLLHPDGLRSEGIGPCDLTVFFTTTPPPDAIPSPAQIEEGYRETTINMNHWKLQWEAMTEQELDIWRTGRFYNYHDYDGYHDYDDYHGYHDYH